MFLSQKLSVLTKYSYPRQRKAIAHFGWQTYLFEQLYDNFKDKRKIGSETGQKGRDPDPPVAVDSLNSIDWLKFLFLGIPTYELGDGVSSRLKPAPNNV